MAVSPRLVGITSRQLSL